MMKAFNESLRSLDCPKAFLGKGLNAKYGSSSSLPRSQPYTDRKSLSSSKIKEKFQQATKTVPTQKGKLESIPNQIVGGRLQSCYAAWEQLTKNQWVLQTIMGHHIKFSNISPDNSSPIDQKESPELQN